jgi:regulator of RNase E activity RraB
MVARPGIPDQSFPDDSTGDALRRLYQDGSDLKKYHDIDFYFVVPSREAAEAVSNVVQQRGFTAELRKEEEGSEWTVTCPVGVIPKYETISRIEQDLEAIAESYGGYSDGWGAFAVD